MKKLQTFLLTNFFVMLIPLAAWATGGHGEASTTKPIPAGTTEVFLIVLLDIIVLSIVASEVIKFRGVKTDDGTTPNK